MKHIKPYKLFESDESIEFDLEDIFLEVNDDTNWEAEVFKKMDLRLPRFKCEKWFILIKPIQDDESKGQKPSFLVIESIKRSIDFMKSNGFKNYQIKNWSSLGNGFIAKPLDLDSLVDLNLLPNNYLRIEFFK
jgi:hypothetical protein